MKIVTSWIREGIDQGLQQGRQEGELAIILRQLNRRFGSANPILEENICQLSLTQLKALADALLDFSAEVDLVNWLQQLSKDDS